MIPGRLSHWREFTPVPSFSSIFVYMISPKRVSHQREFTPFAAPERKLRSGAKSRNGILSTSNDHSFRCEIGLLGGLERVADAYFS